MPITHATVATGTDVGTGDIHKAEWNAGHVGSLYPTIIQLRMSGTTISGFSFDQAPQAGNTLIMLCDGYSTGDPTAITSTNTTWTKIMSQPGDASAKYSLWIGKVSGGTAGTAVTITHPNGYMSIICLEVADDVSTLGQSHQFSAGLAQIPTPPTAGHLVVIAGGTDNTTVTTRVDTTLPVVGIPEWICWMVVGYATGERIYAYTFPQTSKTFIAELT